jgi:hypothetical protein
MGGETKTPPMIWKGRRFRILTARRSRDLISLSPIVSSESSSYTPLPTVLLFPKSPVGFLLLYRIFFGAINNEPRKERANRGMGTFRWAQVLAEWIRHIRLNRLLLLLLAVPFVEQLFGFGINGTLLLASRYRRIGGYCLIDRPVRSGTVAFDLDDQLHRLQKQKRGRRLGIMTANAGADMKATINLAVASPLAFGGGYRPEGNG